MPMLRLTVICNFSFRFENNPMSHVEFKKYPISCCFVFSRRFIGLILPCCHVEFKGQEPSNPNLPPTHPPTHAQTPFWLRFIYQFCVSVSGPCTYSEGLLCFRYFPNERFHQQELVSHLFLTIGTIFLHLVIKVLSFYICHSISVIPSIKRLK